MNQTRMRAGALSMALLAAAAGSPAFGGSSTYDLTVLLDEPYPLESQVRPRTAGVTPVPPGQIYAPARIPPPMTPRRPAARAAPQPRVAQGVLTSGDGSIGARRWFGDIVSELRIGALIHDEGPFSRNKEDGYDGNLELLFVSPDFLKAVWSPRPHFGVTVNSAGDTHQAYLGLSWEWTFWRGAFAGFSLGGAVHTGKLETTATDRKELGCRLLFRESIELGYRFGGKHAITAFLDHISNANICVQNEGLENMGIRYGYLF